MTKICMCGGIGPIHDENMKQIGGIEGFDLDGCPRG